MSSSGPGYMTSKSLHTSQPDVLSSSGILEVTVNGLKCMELAVTNAILEIQECDLLHVMSPAVF
jgi:hypothetical protein